MIKLEELKATYSQENDSCDPDNLGQDIEISTQDAGGGNYYIIKTNRWAFENIKELGLLVKDFEKRFNLTTKATEQK